MNGRGIGNNLDFGERGYDSRIGRFLSVDPLTQSFPYYTPYQFAGNRVISSIDLDGLEDIYYMDKKIESVKGEPLLDVVTAVQIVQENMAKFKDPAYNKGYNIIIVEAIPVIRDGNGINWSGLTNAGTSNLFDAFSVKAGLNAFKKSGEVLNKPLFTAEIYGSQALLETVEQNRGVVLVYLPVNSFLKSKENFKSKDPLKSFLFQEQAKSLAHELIAHAIKKALSGVSLGNKEDHREYFNDPDATLQFQPISEGEGDSPSNSNVRKKWPNSTGGKVDQQVDKETEAMKRVDHKK